MEFPSLKTVFMFLVGQFLLFAIIKCFPLEYNTIDGTTISNGTTDYSAKENVNKFRSYESQNYSGCTVSVVNHLPNKTSPLETTRHCSHELLDAYFLETHQFHGEGTWYVPSSGALEENIEYRPSICKFASILEGKETLQKCLEKKEIRKILVTGDSNGRMFNEGLLTIFRSVNYTCAKTRCSLWRVNGSIKEDDTYFDIPGIAHQRLVLSRVFFMRPTWAPTTYKCTANNDNATASFEIEFIHTGKIQDRSLVLSDVRSGIVFKNRYFTAESLLEYLLKYYYPHRTFPDVWFFTPPFHNMVCGTSLPTLEMQIKTMFMLLDMYLPKSTQIIFAADATECVTDLVEQLATDFKKVSNVTLDERIHEMNQVLYSQLGPELTRHNNYHAFLDATRVACPVTCKWHIDAAHMFPVWYNSMARYNLDLMCNI